MIAGLGHRFGEVVFGMILAEELNATVVFSEDTWSRAGSHGGYQFLNQFLPLERHLVTTKQLRETFPHLRPTPLTWGAAVAEAQKKKKKKKKTQLGVATHTTR